MCLCCLDENEHIDKHIVFHGKKEDKVRKDKRGEGERRKGRKAKREIKERRNKKRKRI